MREEINKKINALDPGFRKKIKFLLENIDESVSLLYEAATHDEKTGLYNNKFFENILSMEIEKAKRGKQKLSIIITDIDFFKKINDKYGHMKADELLSRLAKVITDEIRISDIAARFGGEEFIILLPETNLKKAKKLSARLRASVKRDLILKKHSLNISGGITEFRKKDTKKSFKSRADKALYKAKQSGRDQFVVVK
jgi:diguanylate cyclase (GGDEF)-like protein